MYRIVYRIVSQICRQINVFKGLAETSLRTKADRVRQGIPDIDNPARKKILANTLSTPCLVQFANMAPCIRV